MTRRAIAELLRTVRARAAWSQAALAQFTIIISDLKSQPIVLLIYVIHVYDASRETCMTCKPRPLIRGME